jgi:hypothetical protein
MDREGWIVDYSTLVLVLMGLLILGKFYFCFIYSVINIINLQNL